MSLSQDLRRDPSQDPASAGSVPRGDASLNPVPEAPRALPPVQALQHAQRQVRRVCPITRVFPLGFSRLASALMPQTLLKFILKPQVRGHEPPSDFLFLTLIQSPSSRFGHVADTGKPLRYCGWFQNTAIKGVLELSELSFSW